MLPTSKGGFKLILLAISSKTLMFSLCNLILKKNLNFIFTIETLPLASVKVINHSN